MFCGNCGSKLDDGSVVCSKCGFKLVQDTKKEVESVVEVAAEVKAEAVASVENIEEKATTEISEVVEEGTKDVKSIEENAKVPEVVSQSTEVASQNTDVATAPTNGDNGSGNDGKKGKSKLPLIITAAVAGVVAIVAIIFLCSSSLRNSVKKAFMSDDSYYRSVQKDSLMNIADTMINLYSSTSNSVDINSFEYSIDMNLSVEKEAETFLDKIDNNSRVDLTWLNKAALELVVGKKDSFSYTNLDLDINKEDILEFDAKYDTSSGVAYMGLPLLSDVYAMLDSSLMNGGISIDENSEEAQNVMSEVIKALPTKKELSALAERYIDIVINSISRVKTSEDKSVNVSGVSVNCTKVVVSLDAEELVDLDVAVLEALSADNEVAAILNRLGAIDGFKVDYDQFLDNIDSKIEQLKDYSRTNMEARIEAYVDNSGNVVALTLIVSYDGGSVSGGYDYQYSYKLVENDGNYGFEASEQYITSSRTRTLYAVKASGTKSGSKLTGTADVIVSNTTVGHLDYNELNIASLLKGELDGEFLFDVYDRTGEKLFKNIVVKVTADDASISSGEFVATIYDTKVAIAKITTSYKKSSGSSVKTPSKTEEIKKFSDLTDWMDGFKWDKTISNMESAELPKKLIRAAQALAEGNFTSLANILGINIGGLADFD